MRKFNYLVEETGTLQYETYIYCRSNATISSKNRGGGGNLSN
jgi:hypothetical protein